MSLNTTIWEVQITSIGPASDSCRAPCLKMANTSHTKVMRCRSFRPSQDGAFSSVWLICVQRPTIGRLLKQPKRHLDSLVQLMMAEVILLRLSKRHAVNYRSTLVNLGTFKVRFSL